MKIELGGGCKPHGNGFLNIDVSEHSDLRYNLSDTPWPIEDDVVTDVYSSHCLEHIPDPMKILFEINRICKIGANIIIKVPMPASDLAMVWDHKHVLSPIALINAEHYFPKYTWKQPKRLKLLSINYEPSILLDEAKKELPFIKDLSDKVIMKWFPRTCHECVYNYTVIKNEYYDSHI